jgi:hypothetical protein
LKKPKKGKPEKQQETTKVNKKFSKMRETKKFRKKEKRTRKNKFNPQKNY